MKKMICFTLAIVFMLTMAACDSAQKQPAVMDGGQQTESSTPETTAPEASEPEVTEPSEETTEPSEETTEPSEETTEPSEDVTEPTVEQDDREENHYRPDGSLLYSAISDESGKMVERLAYRDGEQFLRWEYQYDQDGLLSCIHTYDADDYGIGSWGYSGGTLVTEITDRGCTDTLYTDDENQKIWAYDENWNLLEESYYRDGQQDWSYRFTYDENGYLSSETRYDGGEECARYAYVNDEFGNLLREDYYYRGDQQYSFQYTDSGTLTIHYENNKPFWRCHSNDSEGKTYKDVDFFNEQGQVVQSIRYEGYRERWCRTFIYDENGELVSEALQEAGENESVHRQMYYYDGNIVRGYTGRDGWDYKAEYDEQGRLLRENTSCDYEFGESNYIRYEYNADGSYTSVWVGATCGRYYAHYDSDGNLLERYGDDDPGDDPSEVGEWDRYEYNEYGDVIICESYCFGDLIESYRYEYRYDENGNWIEKLCYSDDEEIIHYFRTYDAEGRVIEEVNQDGSYRCTYAYDANGNLAELQEETSSSIERYLYIYDDLGRLSQKVRCYIQK